MKIKSEKDFWSGLMFLLVGVAFAWGATNYNFGSSARPGPAYFPFGLGVLMAILGGSILFKALTFEVDGGDKIGKWAWKPLIMISATVAIFGAAQHFTLNVFNAHRPRNVRGVGKSGTARKAGARGGGKRNHAR